MKIKLALLRLDGDMVGGKGTRSEPLGGCSGYECRSFCTIQFSMIEEWKMVGGSKFPLRSYWVCCCRIYRGYIAQPCGFKVAENSFHQGLEFFLRTTLDLPEIFGAIESLPRDINA